MTQANTPLCAWFGDPDLKAEVVARMKEHRALDEIQQGFYQEYSETGSGFRGCAVGCTLPNMFVYTAAPVPEDLRLPHFPTSYLQRTFKDPDDGSVWENAGFHGLVEKHYGISQWVAKDIDHVFEDQGSPQAASDFAVAVLETIPVGADLSQVSGAYENWISEEWVILRATYGYDEDTWPPDTYADLTRREAAQLLHLLAQAPVPEPV